MGYTLGVIAPTATLSCRPFQHAVELIGRRWSGAILYEMFAGASRFSDIRDRVPGLSDRLLCERLRELEAQGLVCREVIPSVPVQVRYSLTDSARELLPAIQMLLAWGQKWLSAGLPDGGGHHRRRPPTARERAVTTMSIPLSILDLAPIRPGESASDSFAASVALAQHAEEWGYRRVWYAEHHNMPTIASSATSVLIAHVAAHTRTIRLGAGGIMLPNHAPLTIAEQFGTLEALHPGRIDLGLGTGAGLGPEHDARPAPLRRVGRPLPRGRARAAGLPRRRDPHPGRGRDARARARTSRCTSSARPCSGPTSRRCSACRMPSPRTSRPTRCRQAVAAYRREFRPSAQLEQPYVIAGVNVIAADTSSEAQAAAPRREAQPGDLDVRPRADLHRRGGGRDPRLTRGPACPADVQVRRRRHAGRGQRVPRRLRQVRRRGRAHRRPPIAHHRSQAALRGAARGRRAAPLSARVNAREIRMPDES